MIIDISKHNKIVKWAEIKANKEIEGVIIRCGFGDDMCNQDDNMFLYNVSSCIYYGIPFGVYFYSYAKDTTQAISEYLHIKRLCTPLKNYMSLPVYIDVEEKGCENVATAVVTTIGDRLEADGFFVGVYANQYWWNNYLIGVDRFTKWVARYSNEMPTVKNTDVWQYSSTGKVKGIVGNVDCNKLINKDLMFTVESFYTKNRSKK